jgi:ATP-binding cassette subfamily F protein uup
MIEQLENEIEELQSVVNSPDFFKQEQDFTSKTLNQLTECESKLEQSYARWEELEEKQQNLN